MPQCLHGFIWWNHHNIKEQRARNREVKGKTGGWDEDRRTGGTEDEMEIQSDKKQERRTKTQSWRVRERANSGRGESREMKEEE